MGVTLKNFNTLKHKADQYDSVVKELNVCDGGRYRADTISSITLRLRDLDKAEALIKDLKKEVTDLLNDKYELLRTIEELKTK